MPKTAKQLQYEALRALIIDNLTAKEVADKFNYSTKTIYSLARDAKSEKIQLFPEQNSTKGPQERRVELETKNKIIRYRNKNLSAKEIEEKLLHDDIMLSARTIQRILNDFGFKKLERRTNRSRKITKKKELVSEKAMLLNFNKLEAFKTDCPVAGVFFFIPYIIESGMLDIVKKCKLPKSSSINNINAALSMLLLKLIGTERLSHIGDYDHEDGFGIFAGLNYLPKTTFMNTYSCMTSESMLMEFQKNILKVFRSKYKDFYDSEFINLDFHSIPHYGEDPTMEKVWCGARGKTMNGANTILAQDGSSDVILYTKADILRKDEAGEILNFVEYWKKIDGNIDETLVFDCKLTKYSVLNELNADEIKFITLRKRNQSLIKHAYNIDEQLWRKVHLKIKKRKFPKFWTYEEEVKLAGVEGIVRQIIIKGHGRERPTFIITNNRDLKLTKIIEVYAKRWHIENKLSELVSFFNLNALSSPLMIRIHFDIIWTLIADTLYKVIKQDLPRFEDCKAQTIFKKFINMPGKIEYDGKDFKVKIRKRASTPILKGIKKLNEKIKIPWLNNSNIEFLWTF